jgi:hypothetical protein
VKIWNRTDCCEDRLREFHIFVSEAPFSSTDPAVLLTDPDVFELFQAGENGVSQSYELGVPGRYLRIQFDRAERLHMAEVQVFSSAWFGAPIESIAVGNDYLTAGGILDAALSNLVINRSDFYDNDTGAYQRLRVDEFSFHAAALGDPVTPFVAEMTQGGSFVVRAIGSTRLPMEMQLGPNSFAFGAIEAPVIEVPPGSKIVVGFLDAAPDGSGGGAASVVSFVESGATDLVYWTGGELGSSSGSVAEGLSPGLGEQTRPYLQRDYQYQVSFTRMEHIPLVGVGVDTPDLARTAAVRLASPVPNPFNPSTVLRMSLTTSSQVDWAIYDVRGRRVLTLAQGILPAGEHVRVWHGEDHQGARVASGVYFQRVSVPGTGSRTNKMVLLK